MTQNSHWQRTGIELVLRALKESLSSPLSPISFLLLPPLDVFLFVSVCWIVVAVKVFGNNS